MTYLENDPKEGDSESNSNTSESNQTQTVSNEDYWNTQENSKDYISKSERGENFQTKEQ